MQQQHFLLLSLALLLSLHSPHGASAKAQAKAVHIPVYRTTEGEYTVHVSAGTPPRGLKMRIDLEQDYVSVVCDTYNSSTYKTIPCASATCRSYNDSACSICYAPQGNGCHNSSCAVPGPSSAASSELFFDTVSFADVTVRQLPLACADDDHNTLGISSASPALPKQISAVLDVIPKVAICLPGGTRAGAVAVGASGPYTLRGTDVSAFMQRTPLVWNRQYTDTYYVSVLDVKVGGVRVAKRAVELGSDGKGGTKVSSTVPYTKMATWLYNATSDAFVAAAGKAGMRRVAGTGDFGVCFERKSVVRSSVPMVEFVLPGNGANVSWAMNAHNTLVGVRGKKEYVDCLAFIDAGEQPLVTMTIGTYQLRDNLLVFDLSTSFLEFSSSLSAKEKYCADSNLLEPFPTKPVD